MIAEAYSMGEIGALYISVLLFVLVYLCLHFYVGLCEKVGLQMPLHIVTHCCSPSQMNLFLRGISNLVTFSQSPTIHMNAFLCSR